MPTRQLQATTWIAVVLALSGSTARAIIEKVPGQKQPKREKVDPNKPVCHLVGPDSDYAKSVDPLVAETALRLAALELTCRQNVPVRYWPHEAVKAIPKDAYPRVTLRQSGATDRRHVRLRRIGAVFLMSASTNGRDWVEIGQVRMEMPKTAYVGVWVPSCRDAKESTVRVDAVRVNGKGGEDLPFKEFGKSRKETVLVRHGGGRYEIRTFGWTPEVNATKDRGAFGYVKVEGDFTVQCHVGSVGGDSLYKSGGVLCRSSLEDDADSVGTAFSWDYAYGMVQPAGTQASQRIYNRSLHQAEIRIAESEKDGYDKESSVLVNLRGYRSAMASADRLTRDLLETLREETGVGSEPLPSQSLDGPQRERLAEARNLALQLDPAKVVQAGQITAEVLNRSPRSAEAHRTMALCLSMLAMADLQGAFQSRGRYLAAPLAHLMLAERLAPSSEPEQLLNEAWVLLVCGYPKLAAALPALLPDEATYQGELRALRMFATRNYTTASPEAIATATPLEKLAWVWACQQTGREDMLAKLPSKMAREHNFAGMLPMYRSAGSKAGYEHADLRSLMVTRNDVVQLLGAESIPAKDRHEVGWKLAHAVGAADDEDVGRMVDNITHVLDNEGLGDNIQRPVEQMVQLYAMALREPVQPTFRKGKPHFDGLSLADYAYTRRGLLLLTMYRQAYFLARVLDTPDGCQFVCDSVAEATKESLPSVARIFWAYSAGVVGQMDEGGEHMRAVNDSELGKTAPVRYFLLHDLDGTYVSIMARDADRSRWGSWMWRPRADRGGWETGVSSAASIHLGMGYFVFTDAAVALSCDPANPYATEALCNVEVTGWAARTLEDRLPYSASLMRQLANTYRSQLQYSRAITVGEKLRKLRTTNPSDYLLLGKLYAHEGRYDDAIAVAQEGLSVAEPSLERDALAGHQARWLVATEQTEMALEVGKTAAKAHSIEGMRGLLRAQVAANQPKEALATARKISHRDVDGVQDLIIHMVNGKYETKDIVEEIAEAISLHRAAKGRSYGTVLKGCLRAGGQIDLLKAIYYIPSEDGENDEDDRDDARPRRPSRIREDEEYVPRRTRDRDDDDDETDRPKTAEELAREAEKNKPGPQADLHPAHKDKHYMWAALCERKPMEAYDYFLNARKQFSRREGGLNSADLVVAWVAARMTGNDAHREEVERAIKEMLRSSRQKDLHLQFAVGEISAAEMENRSFGRANRLWTHLMLAVFAETEGAGDEEKALTHYRKALAEELDGNLMTILAENLIRKHEQD